MSKYTEMLERQYEVAQAKLTEQLELAEDRIEKVLVMRDGVTEFNLHNHNEWIRQAQVKLGNARSYMAQSKALKDAISKVKHMEESEG